MTADLLLVVYLSGIALGVFFVGLFDWTDDPGIPAALLFWPLLIVLACALCPFVLLYWLGRRIRQSAAQS